MAVSLARYNYTKTPLSSRRHKEAVAQIDFPHLPAKVEVKAPLAKKSDQDRTAASQFVRTIKSNIKATFASHPSRDLMAELRQGSQPMDALSAWWAGHTAVSLQRRSATELNTAGPLERVGVFRCNGSGQVVAPDNFKKDEPICPPIPLRSVIYYKASNATAQQLVQTNHHCMTAYVDPTALAQDIKNCGIACRNANGTERISLWEVKSLRHALASLVNQWKAQLHNATDTHFCYGALEREYTCSCTPSKKQLMITAIQDIMTLDKLDKPIEPERKSPAQHPLHPISGFELGTLLIASAHEVKDTQTGKPRALVFMNELVQHMLRTFESDTYRAPFNVAASVMLGGADGPYIKLYATRDIARGDVLAAVLDKGIERFNPYSCAKRYQAKKSIQPDGNLTTMESYITANLIAVRAFLTMTARSTQTLEFSDTILYAHATDAITFVLMANAKLSEAFMMNIGPIIGDLIKLLEVHDVEMDKATSINRRRREGRALLIWARALNMRIESLRK